LLIPLALTWYFMAHPSTSYTTFLIVAAFAGLGGGNFASSIANINAFYPQRLKGRALGLNAGGGNLGVPAIQLVGLLVIATAGAGSPHLVCATYLVLVGLAALGAALFMDNLDNQTSNAAAMRAVLRFADAWVIALLYIGTFGSFVGYSFAFGQLLELNYQATPGTTAAAAGLEAAQIAFVGPLLGSLSRPAGGWLADRIGGARITLWCFAAMAAAAGILVAAATVGGTHSGKLSGAMMACYIAGFILLFILSGIGNGSVFKMIPVVFATKSLALKNVSPEEAAGWARAMSGGLMGIAGALWAGSASMWCCARPIPGPASRGPWRSGCLWCSTFSVSPSRGWFSSGDVTPSETHRRQPRRRRPGRHAHRDGERAADKPSVAVIQNHRERVRRSTAAIAEDALVLGLGRKSACS
jgi:NNP family nitrate/nitrite transporter-like MFS transporter